MPLATSTTYKRQSNGKTSEHVDRSHTGPQRPMYQMPVNHRGRNSRLQATPQARPTRLDMRGMPTEIVISLDIPLEAIKSVEGASLDITEGVNQRLEGQPGRVSMQENKPQQRRGLDSSRSRTRRSSLETRNNQ